MELTQAEKDLIQYVYKCNPETTIYYEDYNNNDNNNNNSERIITNNLCHLYYKDSFICCGSCFESKRFFPIQFRTELKIIRSNFYNAYFHNKIDDILHGTMCNNVFSSTYFFDSTFYDLDFFGNMIQSIFFKNCTFCNCRFYYNFFNSANFADCNFENCDLYENTFLSSINFYKCHFNNMRFQKNKICIDTISTVTGKGLSTITTDEFNGAIIGYKKCWVNVFKEWRLCIVTLLIPNDAKINPDISLKRRCSKAKVLRIESIDGSEQYTEARSSYMANFIYKVGETVEVSDFDETPFKTCSTGIHFFLNRKDAENYGI